MILPEWLLCALQKPPGWSRPSRSGVGTQSPPRDPHSPASDILNGQHCWSSGKQGRRPPGMSHSSSKVEVSPFVLPKANQQHERKGRAQVQHVLREITLCWASLQLRSTGASHQGLMLISLPLSLWRNWTRYLQPSNHHWTWMVARVLRKSS